MQLKRIIWAVFYIIGADFTRLYAKEKANHTENLIDLPPDDYESNYPDYMNRDYHNLDYYDDNREGRNLQNDPTTLTHGMNIHDDDDDSEDFMMKQLKSTIPGTPGLNYALYQSVPDTSFKCATQMSPGFYGDVEAQCQVFHICQEDDRQNSFLCPIGTVFNQISFICDWWFNFNCEDTPTLYYLNRKFDSLTGSTDMRDTMKRMKNFEHKKDMHMIMGLAKIHNDHHTMKNRTENNGYAKHSMSSRNLFMLGMRKKLEHIKNRITTKRDTIDLPVVGTPVALKAIISTEYLDILPSHTTDTNLDDSDHFSTPHTVKKPIHNYEEIDEKVYNLNKNYSTTEVPLNYIAEFLNSPLKSQMNLSSMELVINGTIPTTTQPDHLSAAHTEVSTLTESLNINTDAYELEKSNKEHFENNSEIELETEYISKANSNAPGAERNLKNNTRAIVNLKEFTEPTIIPSNKPFSHENNFIIGNDTHISVSVTIHSKSGHSKLRWKRLPGFKRIRKVRYRKKNETDPFQTYPDNETIYKKRINQEKPRSRVMWIPAKKYNLERSSDWESYLKPSTHSNTINSASTEPNHILPLERLQKAAFESSTYPSIRVSDMIQDVTDNETEKNNQISLKNLFVKVDSSEKSITTPTATYTEANFMINTERFTQQFREMSNFSSETGNPVNMTENQNAEVQDCKTICIKLLRSVHINSSKDSESATNFGASLTLFDYENSEMQNNEDYNRKTVLGISPSEQWTVKYDPGPNCNENTENDKVLIKGWSVIIDAGSVTKEKTVKKRTCKDTSTNKITIEESRFNPNQNPHGGSITFNVGIKPPPVHSKAELGSTDQHYWLNLIRNWLEQSQSNRNTGINNMEKGNDQNLFSIYKFSNQTTIRPKNLQLNTSPERHRTNLNPRSNQPDLKIRNNNYDPNESTDVKVSSRFHRRGRNSVQTSRAEWSDLQTERSDWAQATHTTMDWSNVEANRRDSIIRDIISYKVNEDNPVNDRRGESTYNEELNQDQNYWLSKTGNYGRDSNLANPMAERLNERPDQDYDDHFSDQDFDDQSSHEAHSQSWMGSFQDRPSNEKMDKPNWSGKKRGNQNKGSSMPPRGSKTGSSGIDNSWLNDNQKTVIKNPNKEMWPKASTRANDRSFGNENNRNSRRDDRPTSSKNNFDAKNNKGKQNSWIPVSPGGANDRAVRDEWNWSQNKDFKGNTRSMKGDSRTNLSPRNPHDGEWLSNKGFLDRNDWSMHTKDNKRNLSSGNSENSKKRGNDWHSDKEMKWEGDSASKRLTINQRDGEQVNNKSRTSGGNHERRKEMKRNSSPDWYSKTDVTVNWNNGPPDVQSKGNVFQSKGFTTKPSRKNPRRKDDESDDTWPSKSPRIGQPFPDHSSPGSSNKGYPNLESNRRRMTTTSQKSWNSKSWEEWKDDDESWMPNVSEKGSPRRQGKTRLTTPNTKNLKGESDSITSQKMKPDSAESWIDHKLHTAVVKDDRNLYRPSDSNRDNNLNQGSDSMSWANKGQSSGGLGGYSRGSHKSRTENRNTWGSSKDTNLNMRPSTPTKGSIRNRSTMLWKNNVGTKNSTKNKSDLELKEIKWSIQISSDGKLENGWIPITLRPNLRRKENVPKNDWNYKEASLKNKNWDTKSDSSKEKDWNRNEDSSEDGDWYDNESPSRSKEWNNKSGRIEDGRSSREGWYKNEDDETKKEIFLADENWNKEELHRENKESAFIDKSLDSQDAKKTNWNLETSHFSETKQNSKRTMEIEISPSTTHTPQASFSHLFYIPFYKIRYKRSYTNKDQHLKAKEVLSNRSYKTIKSGEILKDGSKNNDKFFLAQADIIVQNERDMNRSIEKNLNFESRSVFNTGSPLPNHSRLNSNKSIFFNNTNKFGSVFVNETNANSGMIAKESIIKERWSPFISSNFSASGWIPVTTFKASRDVNYTNTDSQILDKNKASNRTGFPIELDELKSNVNVGNQDLNRVIVKNLPEDFSGVDRTVDVLSNDKMLLPESTSDTYPKQSRNGTEMKVGNETLRILSFSDIMKQFQNEDIYMPLIRNTKDSNPTKLPWNTPITIDPTIYSVKLIDTSKEKTQNTNSWTFSSNENGTNQAWILVRNSNMKKESPSSENINGSEENRDSDNTKPDAFKISSDQSVKLRDKHRNSTLIPPNYKTHSRSNSQFTFTKWNADSDWTPVIRTVGRVISSNRTLLLLKETNAQ